MNRPMTEPWLARALALLDESAASMDAATRARLTQARHAALAQRGARHRGWVIGGGLAAAALTLLLATGIGHRHGATPVPDTQVQGTDADADASGIDAADLYENLDFYVWLDAEQQGHDD